MGQIISNTFFRILRGKPEVKVFLAGLRGAGKTTILYKLKLKETVTTIPTIGINVESVSHSSVLFNVWDIGRQGPQMTRFYYQNTRGMIFVVDASDKERLLEVRETLIRLTRMDELRETIFLVFANKQDLPGAMNATELTAALGLNEIIRHHCWFIQPASATEGTGLHRGMDWLAKELSK